MTTRWSSSETSQAALGEGLDLPRPPYFAKGRMLYYDAYKPDDHATVAELLADLEGPRWVVSYDDVETIRNLYSFAPRLEYTIGYSARGRTRGREVMFFSNGIEVPELVPPMRKVSRAGTVTRVANGVGGMLDKGSKARSALRSSLRGWRRTTPRVALCV